MQDQKFSMIISHQIALVPNNKQASRLNQAVGVSRFAYNWALAEWKDQYQLCTKDSSLKKPTSNALDKKLNSIKLEKFPWMYSVPSCVAQRAVANVGAAFSRFFAGKAKYPKFKKKKHSGSFYLSNCAMRLDGSRIRIQNIGWVRMREALRFAGKVLSAQVLKRAGKWYVSINVDTEDFSHLRKSENQGVVGVDLGITTLATLSTGEKIAGRKPHQTLLNRVVRLSRSVSRKQKGSKNKEKARIKLARLHERIKNIRRSSIHEATSSITSRFSMVVIEDLNVLGMTKNKHLARAVSDAGFFEFRRHLEYKMRIRGGEVLTADRWFASSKLCSTCGTKNKELSLKQRKWTCLCCGSVHDRDVNAAINLKNLAVKYTVTACGEEGSGRGSSATLKPASKKQELDSAQAHRN